MSQRKIKAKREVKLDKCKKKSVTSNVIRSCTRLTSVITVTYGLKSSADSSHGFVSPLYIKMSRVDVLFVYSGRI